MIHIFQLFASFDKNIEWCIVYSRFFSPIPSFKTIHINLIRWCPELWWPWKGLMVQLFYHRNGCCSFANSPLPFYRIAEVIYHTIYDFWLRSPLSCNFGSRNGNAKWDILICICNIYGTRGQDKFGVPIRYVPLLGYVFIIYVIAMRTIC